MSSSRGPSSVCQRQRLSLGVNPLSRRGQQKVTAPLAGAPGDGRPQPGTPQRWHRAPSHRCSLPVPVPREPSKPILLPFPPFHTPPQLFGIPTVDGRGISIHIYAISPLLLQPAPSHTHTHTSFPSLVP